jgi:hypothetical protein
MPEKFRKIMPQQISSILFPIHNLLSSVHFDYCPTSREVAGSIPDGVIGIFYGLNPSGRTMALSL